MSDSIAIPAETPVMTLPNVTLFPHALLPLFIFEPRYRQMLADVLEGGRVFAVAGLDPERAAAPDQHEPPYAVAGLGVVRASHENGDGTSNLVLQGVARVRFRAIVAETPYRRCAIEVLPTTGGADEAELRRRRDALLGQFEEMRELGAAPAEALAFLRALREPAQFLDVAAFTLCPDPAEKQKLLEELDTAARFARFQAHLRAHTARLRLLRQLQGPLRDEDIPRN